MTFPVRKIIITYIKNLILNKIAIYIPYIILITYLLKICISLISSTRNNRRWCNWCSNTYKLNSIVLTILNYLLEIFLHLRIKIFICPR